MIDHGNRFPRRTILRGAGVALGLPLLDVVVERRRARAAPPRPDYLLTFMIPNGVDSPDWVPPSTGPNWVMQPKVTGGYNWLDPLARHRADVTLVTGLTKFEGFGNQELAPGDVHIRSGGTFATGVPIARGGAGGPSVDQVVARALGLKTIATAIGKVDSPHKSHISWAAANTPVIAERDPAKLWDVLFGVAGGAAAAAQGRPASAIAADCRSVLDFVVADLTRLKARVGTADRQRLEFHESHVRDLEKDVCAHAGPVDAGPSCKAPGPAVPATAALSNERVQLMLRLQLLAFACNRAAVGSFALCAAGNYERVFTWLGAKDNHHAISHRDFRKDPSAIRLQEQHLQDEMKQLAFLLGLARSIPVSGGTMLDRMLVFCANEHGANWDDTHGMGDMPIILAGGAAGRLRRGQHVRYKSGVREQSYGSALLAVVQMFGIERASFGTYATSSLPEVIAP